jgi:general secretion pathway protein A
MFRLNPQMLIKDQRTQLAGVIKPVIKPESVVIKAPLVPPEIKPVVEIKPAKPPQIDFNTWVNNPELNLNTALTDGIKLLGILPSANQATDCKNIESLNLNCLTGKASWEKVLLMNSPIILELSLSNGEKRYALLQGIRHRQALAMMSGDREFPLVEILKVWTGNYLIVWKPPISELKEIYPGQSSNDVIWLRQQINSAYGIPETTANPQFFDKILKSLVMEFQHQNHLFEDGIAGVRTIFYLDNMTRSTAPHLKIID